MALLSKIPNFILGCGRVCQADETWSGDDAECTRKLNLVVGILLNQRLNVHAVPSNAIWHNLMCRTGCIVLLITPNRSPKYKNGPMVKYALLIVNFICTR